MDIKMRKNKRMIKSKKGQITIFVILAIAIVGVLLVLFLPRIKLVITPATPEIRLQECLSESVEEAIEVTRVHGGSIEPELYYRYNDENIEYICYTNQWYDTCVMQKPFLKKSMETEIIKYAKPRIDSCVNNVLSSLRDKGYSVEEGGTGSLNVRIVPDKVLIELEKEFSLEKDGKTEILNRGIKEEVDSNIYEMVAIASSILNYEARYGDSSPESYMVFYPNLRIEKKDRSDGTTIYIITDRETEELFQFASRSLAFPPGYQVI